MGITLKNIDPKSKLREFTVNIDGTASSVITLVHIPWACKYTGLDFGAGAASAGLAIGISNINTTDAIISAGHILVSASNDTVAAGKAFRFSASQIFNISKNSILSVDFTATTGDKAICLHFAIDENKEK